VNSSRPPRPRCGRHVWTRTQLQAALKRAGCKRGIAAEADRIRDIFRDKWPTSRRLSRLPGGVKLHEEGEHLFAACCRPPRQGGGRRVPSASGRRDPAELPRLGVQLAARILAEIGDDRTRFADARGLKAYAGSSPITRASGEKSSITRRWVKNDRLNHVGYLWAFAAPNGSLGAQVHYHRRRDAQTALSLSSAA
jgi:hypothetical protein